jgi:transposase-like protein
VHLGTLGRLPDLLSEVLNDEAGSPGSDLPRRAFDVDVIEFCVRWYISYRLSYRDLVEMMAERGVEVAHSMILRSVTRYVPEFE